jgi:uncharacterized coiled-coil protein SlyX
VQAYQLENDMKEETRIALLEQSISHINETLNRLDSKLDRIEKKMDDGFEKINSRIWFNFYWTIAGLSGVLGILAHALRWI